MRLTVVHRQGCELCDEMLRDLEALARRSQLPPLTVVDVDSDPELLRRHDAHIPVLLLDDSVVCRHHLDEIELLRLLRGAGRASRIV